MNPNPLATYRLQFQKGFGFKEAAEIAAYLEKLGVSHIYASPYLQARPGSTHGYDVVDAAKVNEELGGVEAHAQFCQKLQSLGLFQIIDIVPNHMAISGRQNPWWWDILKNGPSSRYASYFDVDWESSEERWPNKILLPLLGNHYGRILEEGQLSLVHKEGAFTLHYHDHIFPIDSSSLVSLLGRAAEASQSELLAFLADSHARLPKPTVTSRKAVELRHRDKALLFTLLSRLCRENAEVNEAINAQVAHLNSDSDALDQLIELQNYRLAYWKTASRDLGYRRFFDVQDLAGLKMENEDVFNAIHSLPKQWEQKGWIHGLRIDHPDGLRNPTQYFQQLKEMFPKSWVVAEKILEPGEKIPEEWPIAGTTGYDFIYLLNNLFVDSQGERPLTEFYQKFCEEQTEFLEIIHTCKKLVLTDLLGSELNRLTSLFVSICENHRNHRDYTRHELHEALRETAVCFPVYRSYVDVEKEEQSERDIKVITQAVEEATNNAKEIDPELLIFLKDILLLKHKGPLEIELAMRFQQLTGPVMAKGVEDTAFYRFNRLISLNEVGGNPAQFGMALEAFHQICQQTQLEKPYSMLASTTHDTKRSEDVRARLAVLSEIPMTWISIVEQWYKNHQSFRPERIDKNTEYLLYQTLVGAWPISLERVQTYMLKAVREAKRLTNWTAPNESFEKDVSSFIEALYHNESFLMQLKNFVYEIMEPSRINSLAQVLLKLTTPGVPDFYQGSELWDFRLVDPDNRQLIDFEKRNSLLDELEELKPVEIFARMDEGLPKLWIIQQTLKVRKEHPEWFGSSGTYQPLLAEGVKKEHLVAFMRSDSLITIAPRLNVRLGKNWDDTHIKLPPGTWKNIFQGETLAEGKIYISDLLKSFPVALLVKSASNKNKGAD